MSDKYRLIEILQQKANKEIINDIKRLFLSKVLNNGRCWEWNGSISEKGYGHFWYHRKRAYAHRVSYLLFKGEIPDNLFVLHDCDNPKCVNPDHLHLGTKKDNLREAIERNRHLVGELNPRAKLNTEKVKTIKQLLKQGKTMVEISRMFRVKPNAIGSIKYGVNWKHVKI